MKPPMIVLTGPTAVGKTRLSLALARAVNGEVISADSMQVYRHMDIGSAKITREQMQGIPHHMIDILEPWEPFNVVIFQQKCKECLKGIYDRNHIPVVTGGTGFYIQALLRDVDFGGAPGGRTAPRGAEDGGYRSMLERTAAEQGAEALHEMLRKVDPASAEAIHANNIKRTIRALEFYQQTGRRISEHNERERQRESAYRSCYFVLTDDREKLYARIDRRVDEMLAAGLVEEVKKLREMGCNRGMVSMQGLGYKEILAWLEKETTFEQAVETLKRDTRHFAKRQLTWFRREGDVIWVDRQDFPGDEGEKEQAMLKFMLERLKEAGIASADAF